MVTITLSLPMKVLEYIKKKSKGKTIEEFIGEVLLININDLGTMIEFHLRLCEKYIHEVERSRKSLGILLKSLGAAVAQIVKAVVAKEGKELRGHRELWEYVRRFQVFPEPYWR